MIKSYSKSKNGNQMISASFRVREFACGDGSDSLYIDAVLADILQKIRDWASAAVTITSAYRTPQYNLKVGGASESYHVKGQAADIVVSGKTPVQVAAFAEQIGVLGVGMYDGTAGRFVHVDTRPVKYFWINTSGANLTVTTHGGVIPKQNNSNNSKCPYAEPNRILREGSCGEDVKWVQWHLNGNGFGLSEDGAFGSKTLAAVKSYQKSKNLMADGVVGAVTREAFGS